MMDARLAMDEEKTGAFELGHGPDACLVLHGFTGSPWDVRPLAEALAARGMRVVAPLLPGHGATPQALLGVTWRDWRDEARRALDLLRGHRQVFVAGLSMGALLAVGLAADAPARVRGLVLAAPALRFRGARMRVIRQLSRTPLLEWVHPWVAKSSTDISDPAVLAMAPILSGFPVARLRDVVTLQDAAARSAARVRCPVLIAVAEQDHVVDPRGGLELARRLKASPCVRVLSLQRGFHIIPRDTDGPRLAREACDFLTHVCNFGEWEPQSAGT
ncbi:alpha/beta fold family hydrolase [Myxococcus stipitatus DSM 14675]|uniref:Alpha/beta fold family hydrolase n=2 Tax=Myxococcus stipitatus TaxID=83455 RepID=L7UI48_MYXSD|nr:alpha/beta fold family hydrolase [Myxococcus stipitatus DSM 14675]